METVILPELGEGIEKATVACWHVKPGATVDGEDDIVEMVTDKASFNVPAGTSGILKDICCKEGQEVNIGSVLAHIEKV